MNEEDMKRLQDAQDGGYLGAIFSLNVGEVDLLAAGLEDVFEDEEGKIDLLDMVLTAHRQQQNVVSPTRKPIR